MKNKELAQRLLYNINKGFADSPYVDMPAATDASYEQRTRAQEGNESLDAKNRKEQRNIEITRHILSIDSEKYDVDIIMANKLAGYIEGNKDAILELKMELGQKIKLYYVTAQKVKSLKAETYATEMDFIRAKQYETKKLQEFENRIQYVQDVIAILDDYSKLNAEEEEHKKVVDAEEDFDFSYMNTNGNNGYQNLG